MNARIIRLARANGVLDELRRYEIEKRIAEKYTMGQEFRLFAEKAEKPDAWQEHEAYVAAIKAAVDAEIEGVEK